VDQNTTQTLTNKTFKDDTFKICDNSDTTKILQFEVSTIPTNTTRTARMPNVTAGTGSKDLVLQDSGNLNLYGTSGNQVTLANFNYRTDITKVQQGVVDIGSSVTQKKGVSVAFATSGSLAFSAAPKVLAVVSTEINQTYNDAFVVTARTITTSGFTAEIYRVDGTSWGQAPDVTWLAWE
jgi:hypothetical protein